MVQIGYWDVNLNGLHPEGSIFDHLDYKALSDAFSLGFTLPFQLHYTDAKKLTLRRQEVFAEKDKIVARTIFEAAGKFQFPMTLVLLDAVGRSHKVAVSKGEMRRWMETALSTDSPLRFPNPKEGSSGML